MVALAQQIARRRIVPSRLFNDRPEESLRLRLLTLLTVLSVALSLGWVTDDLVIPVVGSALAAAGHFASWRWRRSSLGYRSTAIMVAIVALSIATRDDFVSAFSGDRLPVAQYLLLIIGTASFGTRTRGGLYAQARAPFEAGGARPSRAGGGTGGARKRRGCFGPSKCSGLAAYRSDRVGRRRFRGPAGRRRPTRRCHARPEPGDQLLARRRVRSVRRTDLVPSRRRGRWTGRPVQPQLLLAVLLYGAGPARAAVCRVHSDPAGTAAGAA